MGIFSKLKQTFSSKKDGDRYLSGLDKSKKSFSERIRKMPLGFTGVNEEFLEDLMVVLLEADIGIKTAQKIVDEVEAIQEAKSKNYGQCNELVRKGNEQYAKGHRIHQRLVQEEAGGNPVDLNLLLTHAQDLLMSAESFKILCDEFVDLYRKFDELEEKIYEKG